MRVKLQIKQKLQQLMGRYLYCWNQDSFWTDIDQRLSDSYLIEGGDWIVKNGITDFLFEQTCINRQYLEYIIGLLCHNL